MNIRLKHEYRGWKSKERLIPAGDYDENDERLFGIAQYLVDTGLAVYVDENPAALIEPEAETFIDMYSYDTPDFEQLPRGDDTEPLDGDGNTLDYDDMTVDELRAECTARGIDLDDMDGSGANGNLLKADLVEVLRGDDMDTDIEE